MDEPLQIMVDVFVSQGKSLEEIIGYTSGLEDPEDQLDMAEWMLNHEEASRQEICAEAHRLMRNRMKK